MEKHYAAAEGLRTGIDTLESVRQVEVYKSKSNMKKRHARRDCYFGGTVFRILSRCEEDPSEDYVDDPMAAYAKGYVNATLAWWNFALMRGRS